MGIPLLFFKFFFGEFQREYAKGVVNLDFFTFHHLPNYKMRSPTKRGSLRLYRGGDTILTAIDVNGGDSLKRNPIGRAVQH
jgi:hypothetical protein